jgi:hypothetical protein
MKTELLRRLRKKFRIVDSNGIYQIEERNGKKTVFKLNRWVNQRTALNKRRLYILTEARTKYKSNHSIFNFFK